MFACSLLSDIERSSAVRAHRSQRKRLIAVYVIILFIQDCACLIIISSRTYGLSRNSGNKRHVSSCEIYVCHCSYSQRRALVTRIRPLRRFTLTRRAILSLQCHETGSTRTFLVSCCTTYNMRLYAQHRVIRRTSDPTPSRITASPSARICYSKFIVSAL